MDELLRFEFEGSPGALDVSEGPMFEILAAMPEGKDEPKALTRADFGEPAIESTDEATTLTFKGNAGAVRCTFRAGDGEILCSIRVEASGTTPMTCVRFPLVQVDPAQPFDRLLLPHPMGDNMRFPTRVLRERFDGAVEHIYPGAYAMQYMALHNRARTVYVAGYSTGDESYGLRASSDGDELTMSAAWYPFIEGKGVWESPECGIALLRGGWHAAADLYRKRMEQHFPPPQLPKWMAADFHGWVQFPMLLEGSEPACTFKELPNVYKRIAAHGMNTLHVYGWTGVAFDTRYPEYVVNPVLGTAEDVKAAMDRIRAMGGHVILYTNGRLIDHETDYYRQGGDKSACRKADGSTYIERYGTSATFDVGCPGSRMYRDKMVEAFEDLTAKYGAHAAQIDQVSCAPPYFCWAKDHDHDKPSGNFGPGYDDMLRRIHETYRKADPDFFVWIEGCSERFGRFYEVHQGHGEEGTWTTGESLPEQYQYTYPKHLCSGISDGVQKLCHTYGQGKAFDFHMRNLDEPAFVELLHALLAARRGEAAYFLRGRFLDDAPLEYVGIGVRMWALERDDGKGLLVNVWSQGTGPRQEAEAVIAAPRPGMPRSVMPDDLIARECGGWLSLAWSGPVATLVWED